MTINPFLVSIILLISLVMPTVVGAFPIVYERLVLLNIDKEPIKIVDLVGDFHLSEAALSTSTEFTMMPSEVALLETLKKIGERKDGPVVEVFGESSQEYRENIQASGVQKEMVNGSLLNHLGVEFYKDFRPEMRKGLIYSDADTYRKGNQLNVCALLLPDNLLEQDLSILKQENPEIYRSIFSLWGQFKIRTLEPFCKSKDNLQYLLSAIIGPMDFEIVIRIFQSKHRHNIVFAGDRHIKGVSSALQRVFKFILVEKAGEHFDEETLIKIMSSDMDEKELNEVGPIDSVKDNSIDPSNAFKLVTDVVQTDILVKLLSKALKFLPPLGLDIWDKLLSTPSTRYGQARE